MPQLPSNPAITHSIDLACYNQVQNTVIFNNPSTNEVTSYSLEDGDKALLTFKQTHFIMPTKIAAMDVSLDGIIAAVSRNSFIKIWNEREEGSLCLPISSTATCLKWCNQGNKFAIGTVAGEIFLVYFSEKRQSWSFKSFKCGDKIMCINWEDTGSLLAVGCLSGYVKIYVATSKLTKTDSSNYGDCVGAFKTMSWVYDLAFLRKTLQIVAVNRDGEVLLLDLKSGTTRKIQSESKTPLCKICEVKNSSFYAGDFNSSAYFVKILENDIIIKNIHPVDRIGEKVALLWRKGDRLVHIDKAAKLYYTDRNSA